VQEGGFEDEGGAGEEDTGELGWGGVHLFLSFFLSFSNKGQMIEIVGVAMRDTVMSQNRVNASMIAASGRINAGNKIMPTKQTELEIQTENGPENR
jgi:hypothetical protein